MNGTPKGGVCQHFHGRREPAVWRHCRIDEDRNIQENPAVRERRISLNKYKIYREPCLLLFWEVMDVKGFLSLPFFNVLCCTLVAKGGIKYNPDVVKVIIYGGGGAFFFCLPFVKPF